MNDPLRHSSRPVALLGVAEMRYLDKLVHTSLYRRDNNYTAPHTTNNTRQRQYWLCFWSKNVVQFKTSLLVPTPHLELVTRQAHLSPDRRSIYRSQPRRPITTIPGVDPVTVPTHQGRAERILAKIVILKWSQLQMADRGRRVSAIFDTLGCPGHGLPSAAQLPTPAPTSACTGLPIVLLLAGRQHGSIINTSDSSCHSYHPRPNQCLYGFTDCTTTRR
ncbi:hypothetical protein J6590_038870 [Homalodisca vitripennis]|nr:hypothetical protein J6590_038870 [Homalodisca vitripennis]